MKNSAPHPLDQRELGLFVRHQLNAGLNALDKKQADRLFAARQAALSRYPTRTAGLSLVAAGLDSWHWAEDKLRPALFASMLALALLAGNQFMADQQQDESDDVDSALLSGELPISAYLDNGFQSWLAEPSRK